MTDHPPRLNDVRLVAPRLLASCLLVCLLLAAGCGSRTPPAPVFDKVLPPQLADSGHSLRPHRLAYRKATMQMHYTVVLDESPPAGDDPAWRVEILFPGSDVPDRIWLDRNSLAFRARDLVTGKYRIEVAMEDGHFSGALTPAEGSDFTPVSYDRHYPHDAFEPAIINYAVAGLGLEPGLTASIPVFDLNDGSSMQWSNVEVLGEEAITIDGQSFDTWKVRSDGIKNKTLWIDRISRLAVRMETAGNPGAWEIEPGSIEYL